MMTMKTKRIASLLLSAALLLSLAVPAFAENPTTEETAEPETAVQEVEPEALTEEDAVAPVAEPTAKKEYTYVAIGDSVTAGVGLSGLQYKLVQNGFDMSGNYKGYDGQCFVGYVADQLGLDRDHAINLGLPAVMTKDLADLIETGAMPAMNQYSGVQYTSVPELKEYIQKADLITLQIGANDALIRTIVALGEATNWKSEKLANSMVTGMFRNLTPDNIDYFMDCLKQLTLTPSEFRAGFLVLRATSMPSVLVELGYISTPDEEQYLLSDAGTTALSNSIYKAFLNYKREHDAPIGRSRVQEQELPEPENKPKESRIEIQTAEPDTATEPDKVTKKPVPATQKKITGDQARTSAKPVFKIQILVSNKILPKGSKQLKGVSPVSYYREKGLYKYTYGENTDYNKILRMKRNITPKFKDAFIIAFKNGEKMNVNEAIKEFKKNR